MYITKQLAQGETIEVYLQQSGRGILLNKIWWGENWVIQTISI